MLTEERLREIETDSERSCAVIADFRELIAEVRRLHSEERWLQDENKTLFDKANHFTENSLRGQNQALHDEYENLCKFTTDFEERNQALVGENALLRELLKKVKEENAILKLERYSWECEAKIKEAQTGIPQCACGRVSQHGSICSVCLSRKNQATRKALSIALTILKEIELADGMVSKHHYALDEIEALLK